MTGHCIRRSAPRHSKNGVLLSTPLDGGRTVERETIQCVHCGAVWLYLPGCGNRKRDFGWCSNCGGYHCGPGCQECVAEEQMLENMEAGLPWDVARLTRPIRASVRVSPGGVLLGRV